MKKSLTVGCVIMASGLSRRFGANKLLADFCGQPMLCRALQVSIYASAMPDMQQGGEMDVIAACVIGGVSMSGGRGTVLGALLGSLILATIAKALPLIPFFDQL